MLRCAACAVAVLLPWSVDAGVLNLTVENDVFFGTDRHYSNGVLLAYVVQLDEARRENPRFEKRLPSVKPREDVHLGFFLGQEIYTPDDVVSFDPVLDDRPYAGYLYGAFAWMSSNDDHLDSWRASVGIVGPSARGAEAQNTVHEWIGVDNSNGWDHQLEDEIAVELNYERIWRRGFERDGVGFDLLPHAGVGLGNVATYANAGFTVRVGRGLANDYGAPRIRSGIPGTVVVKPQHKWSLYWFASLDGRYVARNIFLDGNTWKDSLSVHKKRWVGEVQTGVVLNLNQVRVTGAFVVRAREFDGQGKHNEFSSVSITYLF